MFRVCFKISLLNKYAAILVSHLERVQQYCLYKPNGWQSVANGLPLLRRIFGAVLPRR